MIVYWVLVILIWAIAGIVFPLTFLPDAQLPDFVNSSITQISGFIGMVWKFMPLSFVALIAAVGAIVITENWILIYKIIRWVYQKIPGVN